MKKYVIFLCITMTVGIGKASDFEETGHKRMPIVAECKDFVLDYIDRHPHKLYKYVNFDVVLDSHSEIVGYVEADIPIDALKIFRNTLIYECATNAKTIIPKDDKRYFDALSQALKFDEVENITNHYIKTTDDNIFIYNRTNPKIPFD